jgi:DNA helicase II / ATP-dependent DNA helicase PcrA
MQQTMLNKIEITDKDIDEIEPLFSKIRFDAQRRDIIKNLETIDIQALPGTGKTTVLVAKLAVLAKKWPYSYKGICVLSHTNAAREEIQEKLGNTDVGQKLLSYPHFIGTIHSFLDTYIVSPWLKSNGYTVRLIDNDIVIGKRISKLSKNDIYCLQRRHFSFEHLQFIAFPKLAVDLKINVSQTCATYKNILNIVSDSVSNGFYTFDEMIVICKYILSTRHDISEIIQNRFSLLFVDEAQDTTKEQTDLLNKCFCNDVLFIKQCFGDKNQAIFNDLDFDDSDNTFPTRGYKSITNTKRFGQAIADLAQPFAVLQDKIKGENSIFLRNNDKNTVFLFDRKNIDRVLKEYAKLILDSFTDQELNQYKDIGCHAVSMVHKNKDPALNERCFPKSMEDYWPGYNCSLTRTAIKPRWLIDYFYIGQEEEYRTHNMISLLNNISKGILMYFYQKEKYERVFSKNYFQTLLSFVKSENRQCFRKELYKAVNEMDLSQEKWNSFIDKLKSSLTENFEIQIEKSDSYFSWRDVSIMGVDKQIMPFNTYHYTDDESKRSIDIELSSIHAEKGKTHLATLVLETRWYDFNIKDCISCICEHKQLKKRTVKRMKCMFVALTRAMGLVCMAIPTDELRDEEINYLKEMGWNIKTI